MDGSKDDWSVFDAIIDPTDSTNTNVRVQFSSEVDYAPIKVALSVGLFADSIFIIVHTRKMDRSSRNKLFFKYPQPTTLSRKMTLALYIRARTKLSEW